MFDVRPSARRFWYWTAVGMFALGLMSKPMLVTLPFVLLLLDYWPLGRIAEWGMRSADSRLAAQSQLVNRKSQIANPLLPLLLEKAPFLALSLASCVVTYLVQAKGAAMAPAGAYLIEDCVANSLVSCLRYVGKTIWPANLAMFYPLPSMQHPGDDTWPALLVFAAALFVAGITALALRAWRRQPWLAVAGFGSSAPSCR